MKTLLKIAGFVVLGLIAIAVIGFLLHAVSVLFTIAVPVAIVAVVGWVVWKIMAGGGAKAADAPKQVEAAKSTDAAAPALASPASPAPARGMSPEEAARHFDELKKGRPTT